MEEDMSEPTSSSVKSEKAVYLLGAVVEVLKTIQSTDAAWLRVVLAKPHNFLGSIRLMISTLPCNSMIGADLMP